MGAAPQLPPPRPWHVPDSCRWSTSCRSQVPSGCHAPGAAPRRSRSWGPSSAAPGPWSWRPRRAGSPPGPGGSLLCGTGWGCAPGWGHGAGGLALLGDPTSRADAQLPSMVRAGGGSTHDHNTHHPRLPGPCHGVPPPPPIHFPPCSGQHHPAGDPGQWWGLVGGPCPGGDLPVLASRHGGGLWC